MFRIERQQQMLNYVNNKKTVTTQELAQVFGTSVVTVRNDINDMARRGLIVKTHGGAVCIQYSPNIEIPSSFRFQQHVESKEKISAIAADMIEDGDVIILDSGSTTYGIAQKLKAKRVTVITDDLKVALCLAERSDVNLIVTGGTLLPSVYTLVGPETINFIRGIKVRKLFMGCDAIDADWGISNRTIEETHVKRAMLDAAKEVIAVADCSKFNNQVFANICGIDALDVLVTDTIDDETRRKMESAGVRVVTGRSYKKS